MVRQSSSRIFLPVALSAAAHAEMLELGPQPSILIEEKPSSAAARASCTTWPQSSAPQVGASQW